MKEIVKIIIICTVAFSIGGVADLITSVVSCNGIIVSDTSLLSINRSLTGTIVSSGISNYSRSLNFEDQIDSDYQVTSDGPIIIDEYTKSAKTKDTDQKCVFALPTLTESCDRYSEISALGMFQNGKIASVRTTSNDGPVAGMSIQGSGMINRIVRKDGNLSAYDRLFIGGLINSSDFVDLR